MEKVEPIRTFPLLYKLASCIFVVKANDLATFIELHQVKCRLPSVIPFTRLHGISRLPAPRLQPNGGITQGWNIRYKN
ncbi:hypothetical protein D3C72_457410 [compost metagenome]